MYKGHEREIIEEYTAGKLATFEIARKYQISTETLNNIIRASGVPMRGRGAKRRYPIIFPALADAVRARGIKNTELAEKIGSTPDWIGKAMTGRVPMTRKMAMRIANALGEDYKDLFGDLPDSRDSEQRLRRNRDAEDVDRGADPAGAGNH